MEKLQQHEETCRKPHQGARWLLPPPSTALVPSCASVLYLVGMIPWYSLAFSGILVQPYSLIWNLQSTNLPTIQQNHRFNSWYSVLGGNGEKSQDVRSKDVGAGQRQLGCVSHLQCGCLSPARAATVACGTSLLVKPASHRQRRWGICGQKQSKYHNPSSPNYLRICLDFVSPGSVRQFSIWICWFSHFQMENNCNFLYMWALKMMQKAQHVQLKEDFTFLS